MSTKKVEAQLTVRGVDKLSGPFKKMAGATGALGRDVRKHLGKLDEIRGPIKLIEDFRKTSKELRNSANKSAEAKKKVEGLASTYKKAEKPTRKMAQELAKARKEASKANAAYEKNLNLFKQRKSALDQAGISLKDIAKHEREYASAIKETTAAQEKSWANFKKQGEKRAQAAKAKEKFRDGLSTATGLAATGYSGIYTGKRILEGVKSPIDEAKIFNKEMKSVAAVTRTLRDPKKFGLLRNQALRLGESTSFTNVQAASAQKFLGMAGMSVPDILASMPSVLDLSKAGSTDLGRTADIASNVQSTYGIKDMQRISDVMVGTFTRSNVNVSQIGESVKYSGSAARSAGIEFEYLSSMIGKLGDNGRQGSMAGTALNTMINRLAAPPKMAAKQLKKLGVATRDAEGNLRPFSDLLKDLKDATKDLGSAEQLEAYRKIAGLEAAGSLGIILRELDAVEALASKLRKAKGEASEIAKAMSDGAVGDEEKLASAWSGLKTEVGTQLLPAYRELLQTTTSWVTAMREWAQENPGLVKAMGATAAAVGGLVVVAGGAAFAMAGLVGTFVMLRYGGSVLRMAKNIDGFSKSLGSFSGSADTATKKGRGLKSSLRGLGGLMIKAAAGFAAWNAVEQADKFSSMTPEERKGLASKQNEAAKSIPGISSLYDWTSSIREKMFGKDGDLVGYLTGGNASSGQVETSGDLSEAKAHLAELEAEIARTRAGAINQQSADMLAAPLEAEKNQLLAQIESLSLSVAQSGLDDAVQKQAAGVSNSGFPQSLQALASRINSMRVPMAKGSAGSGPALVHVDKQLAKGGGFGAGDRIIVGEKGPELMSFDQPGHVTPNHALGSALGQRNGGLSIGELNIHAAPGMDPHQLVDLTVRRLEERWQMAGMTSYQNKGLA